MSKTELCSELAELISDYRRGEVTGIDSRHVDTWISQFPAGVQEPLLREVNHVLNQTYIQKKKVDRFLRKLVSNSDFAGSNPLQFWQGVKFLSLQKVGHSQKDMLALFDRCLREELDISIADCGKNPHTYVYLDDAVFSGGRVKSDLSRWISEEAPRNANVAIIVMAVHALGEYFSTGDINKAAKEAGKSIQLRFWRAITLENRKAYRENSDVLWPRSIPAEAEAYVAALGATPILRTANGIGSLKLFSSPEARELLEQEFLKAGLTVRNRCKLLPPHMRPLGSTLMRTPGFGSMFITHRNCANNTPLVLWAGDPWYPLFPRKTN